MNAINDSINNTSSHHGNLGQKKREFGRGFFANHSEYHVWKEAIQMLTHMPPRSSNVLEKTILSNGIDAHMIDVHEI